MQTVVSARKPGTRDHAGSTRPDARPALVARAEEFDDFRRVDYSAGWDRDDALLGWVDDDVVHRAPRLH